VSSHRCSNSSTARAARAGGSRGRHTGGPDGDRQALEAFPRSTAAATTSAISRTLKGFLSTPKNPSPTMAGLPDMRIHWDGDAGSPERTESVLPGQVRHHEGERLEEPVGGVGASDRVGDELADKVLRRKRRRGAPGAPVLAESHHHVDVLTFCLHFCSGWPSASARSPGRALRRTSRISAPASSGCTSAATRSERNASRRADDPTSSARGTSPNRPSGDSARNCDTTELLSRTSGTSSLGSDGLPGRRGTVGALASTD